MKSWRPLPDRYLVKEMKEFRCRFCHRLLAKVENCQKVEVKCPKCKTMNLYSNEQVLVVSIDESYLQKRILKGKVAYGLALN